MNERVSNLPTCIMLDALDELMDNHPELITPIDQAFLDEANKLVEGVDISEFE